MQTIPVSIVESGKMLYLIARGRSQIMKEYGRVMHKMTEQEWFESGPINPEILSVWLEILNKSEGESNG
jgi:hypothetical protein